jgi:hypothetical protein
MCTSTVSRAFMTNGPVPAAFMSMPLNAAGSRILPFWFSSVQTGEHAVYTLASCWTRKPPLGEHRVVNASG